MGTRLMPVRMVVRRRAKVGRQQEWAGGRDRNLPGVVKLPKLVQPLQGCHAIVYLQRVDHRGNMGFDGAMRYPELSGDLLGCESLPDQLHALPLAAS